MITNTLLGEVHLYSAMLATLFGTLNLIWEKGTKKHKQIGYAYTVSMLVVNITALMIYRLFGHFGIFHYAAVISLATLLAGIIPIMIKRTNKTMLFIAVGITIGAANIGFRKYIHQWKNKFTN